jgi:hypothetical protein
MPRPPKPSSSVKNPAEDTVASEGLPRDNADRPHVVPASESDTGAIAHDERGHARWKWKTDLAASTDPTAETFNYLKALDTDLEIEQSQKVRVLKESTKTGINPYDTARVKKPK